MNHALVLRSLGFLLLLEAAAMTIPLGVSLAYGESEYRALALAALLTGAAGAAMYLGGRTSVEGFGYREGLAVAALGWVLVAAFGALPFYLGGMFASYVDALFESTSGFTTTGATVLVDIEAQSRGLLFWRSFAHWLGGMGILVLTLAITPIAAGSTKVFQAESPGPAPTKLVPRIKDTARILYGVYFVLSLAEVVALSALGMSLFESVTHTFGTMGTGGFSPRAESIGAYDSPAIEMTVVVFMLVAGTNFALYYRFITGDRGAFWEDREFRAFLGIMLVGTALVTLNLRHLYYDSLLEALRYASFQVASILTTTGYTTADFDRWPEFSRAFLLLLMFVGGSAGSTGGSVKVIRIILLVKYAVRELHRKLHPRAVMPLRLGRTTVPESVLSGILAFFVLYMAIFVVSTLLMTLEGLDLLSAAASVAATLGNIGPGLGLVGPAENYAFISAPGKLLLTLNMILGRLEIYPLLTLLIRGFWRE